MTEAYIPIVRTSANYGRASRACSLSPAARCVPRRRST